MKKKLLSIFMTLILMTILISPTIVFAGAYETDFITSITYQNIGSSATTSLSIQFFESASDDSPVTITQPNLAAGAGTSIYVGGIGDIDSGFQGTAVMSADQPLAATLVQVPQSTTVRNRPLSNGFSSGTTTSLIATVLKNNYNTHTVFSVQNAGSADTTATITFINTSATTIHTINQALKAGAGYHVDAGSLSALGTSFNGSVVITTSPEVPIVSSAMELQYGTGTGASAFEGLGTGGQKFYLPSALCNSYGSTSYYAVQNTSLTTDTSVTVTYSPGSYTETKTIGKGAKASFDTCAASGVSDGYLGSAIIESNTTDVIAIGKVSGNGRTTAFVGLASGPSKVALPYIRWANDTNWAAGSMQRSYIAIQNVGSSTIPANQITVKYVDRTGTTVATQTITSELAVGSKANSNPSLAGLTEFGCYNNCTEYGGSAIVEGPSGSELAVIARVETYLGSTKVAEDYNGIEMP
jgi:hypothetical protein